MTDIPQQLWIIEPRDPLIVRDGRPFGPNPGARAATLPFPFPSTIAGAIRHKAGLHPDGTFNLSQKDHVMTIPICGPLLVELQDDAIANWLLSAPADALLLDPEPDREGVVLRRWLAPCSFRATTNQPDGLRLVGPASPESNKVSSDVPRFWYRDALQAWLTDPQDDEPALATLGIPKLEVSARMHVSVQPETQTAREGALFQTSGLEFTWRDRNAAKTGCFVTKRLALAAWSGGSFPHFDNGGIAPMGGERRLMHWTHRQEADAP
jgi:CRISPR-associated protein Cmr3